MAASLELAISAIRSGRTEEGRQLLNLLIQRNPNDEMAWLWMSSVVGTDEQRARCLYHVLAINPNSELARRGLQLLGIVVSDSRPVKIPRDSQPIKIPKPSSQSKPWSPPVPNPEAASEPTDERRPFRIDPQAIVDELPFKPITHPFNKPVAATASGIATEVVARTPQPNPPDSKPIPANQPPANPVPVSQADIDSRPTPRQAEPSQHPSEPVPAVQSELGSTQKMSLLNRAKDPSEPVSPVQAQAENEEPLQIPGSINLSIPPDQLSFQRQPTGQQSFNPGMPHETRPSQPVPISHSHPTVNMPQQMPYPVQGYQQQQYSPEQMPVHSNVTMGMPAPYYPAQPGPAVHSNATLGMPMPAQQPAGPMYQQPYGQNPAIHSNSTMAMPLGYDPFVAFRNAPNEDYRVVKKSHPGAKRRKIEEEEEDGEEINILAVIIFGSLSITALGGLGMLILLMFTTG